MPEGAHACLHCVLGFGVGPWTTHCLTVFVYRKGFRVLCGVPVCVSGGEVVVGSWLGCRWCFRVSPLPQSAFHHLRNPGGLRDGVCLLIVSVRSLWVVLRCVLQLGCLLGGSS